MIFDMLKFTTFAQRAHENAAGQGYTVYSLEDTLAIFKYYFEWYEHTQGKAHPNIRVAQIERIVIAMPYVQEIHRRAGVLDIDPESYEEMIPQHFKTKYANCDYNINHFFSGQVRELRFFETCY